MKQDKLFDVLGTLCVFHNHNFLTEKIKNIPIYLTLKFHPTDSC